MSLDAETHTRAHTINDLKTLVIVFVTQIDDWQAYCLKVFEQR